jgi:hypothetical protein
MTPNIAAIVRAAVRAIVRGSLWGVSGRLWRAAFDIPRAESEEEKAAQLST